MLRKMLFAFVIFSLLVGCAPAAGSGAPTAIRDVYSFATPTVGSVTVLSAPGSASFPLLMQPKSGAKATGEVKPGDTGKLLGVDASDLWMLVEIDKQTGWIPIQYLDYTIAQ
jgi:hypothetical protein